MFDDTGELIIIPLYDYYPIISHYYPIINHYWKATIDSWHEERDPPRELLDSADEQKRHELMQDKPWQGTGHGKGESSQNAKRSLGSVSKPCNPVVHIKIAGKWMFIPLKMVCIGIDPYPHVGNLRNRPTARI